MTTSTRPIRTTRRTDLHDILVGTPTPFANSNDTLYGKAMDHFPGTGRLDVEEKARLFADAPSYVIFSYATPIAWKATDGTWYVTHRRYSATTDAHLAQVRRGLAGVRGYSV